MACRVHFSASPGFVSNGIQYFTHWRYGHCEMLLDDGCLLGAHIEPGYIVQPGADWPATPPKDSPAMKLWCKSGVLYRHYGYEPLTRVMVCEFKTDPVTVAHIEMEMRKFAGCPYDFKWLFGFIFNRDWNDDTKFGCSEAVVTAAVNADFPLHDYDRMQPNCMTPALVALSDKIETVYEGEPHADGRYP